MRACPRCRGRRIHEYSATRDALCSRAPDAFPFGLCWRVTPNPPRGSTRPARAGRIGMDPRRPSYSLQPTALAFVSVLTLEPRPPGRGSTRRCCRVSNVSKNPTVLPGLQRCQWRHAHLGVVLSAAFFLLQPADGRRGGLAARTTRDASPSPAVFHHGDTEVRKTSIRSAVGWSPVRPEEELMGGHASKTPRHECDG